MEISETSSEGIKNDNTINSIDVIESEQIVEVQDSKLREEDEDSPDSPDELETAKEKDDSDFIYDDSPWYDEDDMNISEVYYIKNTKEIKTDLTDLGIDFRFANIDDKENEIIGDFVKIDFPISKDCHVGANIDLSMMESLFGSSDILAIKENPEFDNIIEESARNAETIEKITPQSDCGTEIPIVPDFDLDFENIFENIEKLPEIEKQLQLLYRPFTCLIDINCRFNLYELSILLDDSRYDPAHHPALVLRLRNPTAEVKLYANGKITSSAISADSARTALLKVIQMIEELDYKAEITHFSKNTVHASFCLPFKIDLQLLSELHADNISGNRETRPFITYKIEDTSIRFAIFANGFVLVLHSTQHSETRAAISGILPILVQFKNGFLTPSEKFGSLCGDISFRLLWERKLEEDKEGVLLYS